MRIKSWKIKFTYENIINLFICLYSFGTVALAAQSRTSWISDIITVTMVCFLGFYHIRKKTVIRLDIYIVCTFLFLFLSFISAIWAMDSSRALSKSKTILLLFVVTMMIYLYAQNSNNVLRIVECVVVGIMFVPIYSFLQYGTSGLVDQMLGGMRVGGDINNVNVLGQYCAVAALGCVYFLAKGGKPYLWGLLMISVVLCLGAGSRQAILYLVIVFFVYYGVRVKPKNFVRTIVILTLVSICLYFLVMKLPYFEYLRTRLSNMLNFFVGSGETDRTMIGRTLMIERGMESFREHPIFGIGINNSTYLLLDRETNYYLHNNFVEILASLGIVGFVVYYLRHVWAGFKMIRLARENKTIALTFSMLIASTIMDYGSVTYYSKISWLLLALEMVIAAKTCSGELIKRS